MEFTFTVTVRVERTQGKFASRDDLEGRLQEALEQADPGSVTGENDGEYDVVDWQVTT